MDLVFLIGRGFHKGLPITKSCCVTTTSCMNINAKDYKHQKIYKGDVICVKRDIMKKQKLQTKKEYNNETKTMFEHIYCI
ncbi:hypothetical protein AGMMS49593_00170 [Endomicrobiia bacterium]|nr:hypothetical protein AGMMS49593_00170 [Endomicrobiia bacterium]